MSIRHLKTAAICGLALSAFSATRAYADLSTWSQRVPVQLQVYNDSTHDYDVVSDVPTAPAPITNGLINPGSGDANGTVFTLTGEQYLALNPGTANTNTDDSNDRGIRLIAINDGALLQPYDPVHHRIVTAFDIGVGLTGGAVNVFNVGSDYSLVDSSEHDLQNVGSGGFQNIYTAGGNESTFQYVDDFSGDASPGTHIVSDWVIGLEWIGFAPDDVLQFSLPNTGVTIQQVAVPEPATLSLIGLPVLGLLARRRRD